MKTTATILTTMLSLPLSFGCRNSAPDSHTIRLENWDSGHLASLWNDRTLAEIDHIVAGLDMGYGAEPRRTDNQTVYYSKGKKPGTFSAPLSPGMTRWVGDEVEMTVRIDHSGDCVTATTLEAPWYMVAEGNGFREIVIYPALLKGGTACMNPNGDEVPLAKTFYAHPFLYQHETHRFRDKQP